jgi:hypothetical protein
MARVSCKIFRNNLELLRATCSIHFRAKLSCIAIVGAILVMLSPSYSFLTMQVVTELVSSWENKSHRNNYYNTESLWQQGLSKLSTILPVCSSSNMM